MVLSGAVRNKGYFVQRENLNIVRDPIIIPHLQFLRIERETIM
jgi:hypothetical protein